MSILRTSRVALFSSLVFGLVVAMCSCEESSGGGTTAPDGAPIDPFKSDGGGAAPDAAGDSSLTDSATDSATDAGIPANPGRIVNLGRTPALLDICFSNTATNFSGTPFLKGRGLPGVPASGGMSAPFVVTPDIAQSASTYFRMIDATVGVCPGVVASPGGLAGVPANGLFVYTGGIIQGADVLGIVLTPPMAGKDTLGYISTSPPRVGTYTPSGGAAMPLFGSPIVNRIDTAVSGVVLTTDDPPAPDVSRAFKPVAGGLVYILAYPEKTVLCDMLAAPVNGLTPCGADVRAP